MDVIAQPLILISIVIGTLNIIERILRRSTKYNRLLEKISKSKEKLVELSHKQLSIDGLTEEELLGDMLDVLDLLDVNFHIPS